MSKFLALVASHTRFSDRSVQSDRITSIDQLSSDLQSSVPLKESASSAMYSSFSDTIRREIKPLTEQVDRLDKDYRKRYGELKSVSNAAENFRIDEKDFLLGTEAPDDHA